MPSNAALRTALAFALDLRETSGTVITDWKSGKVGTAHGGVLLNQPGPGLNRAVGLDGVDDWIEFLNSTLAGLLDVGSGPFSWEIWWKTPGSSNQTSLALSKSRYSSPLNQRWQEAQLATPAGGVSQSYVSTPSGGAPTVNGSVDFDDGDWHQAGASVDTGAGLLRKFSDGAADGTDSLGSYSSPDNDGSLTIGRHLSDLVNQYFLNGTVALIRIWVGRSLAAADWTSLWNDGNALDLQTPEAFSITPNTGRAGHTVAISSLEGDHYSANVTTFLLRKAGLADIVCDSFTPASLTDGAGAITLPAYAVNGTDYKLVVVVNGEESAPLDDAFTVTGVLSAPSTDLLVRRTRYYRCEEAGGDLVDAVAGKVWSATDLAYHQTHLLNYSVKGNGDGGTDGSGSSRLLQTTAAGADAFDFPLGVQRTYAFLFKSTASDDFEVILSKRYNDNGEGLILIKQPVNKLAVYFQDSASTSSPHRFLFFTPEGSCPNSTKLAVVVRIRRTSNGLSVRINGVEQVGSPQDASGLGPVVTGYDATAFATKDYSTPGGPSFRYHSGHEQDEFLVYDTWLPDAEVAILENGSAFRDLSAVPVLDSVDVSVGSPLDDAFVQIVTGANFDLQAPAFSYPDLGLTPVSVTIDSPTQATVVWDLSGQAPGTYPLAAANDNGAGIPLAGALEIFVGFRLRSPSRMDSGLTAMTLTSPSSLDALLGFRALVPARLDAFLDGMTATRPSRMDAVSTLAARVLSRLTSRIKLTVLTPSRLDSLLEQMAARQGVALDALTLKGWDIWATDTATGDAVLLGFIAADDDPKELADVALADAVYEIEARPSEWFWAGARGVQATTLITNPDGGGGPTTGLPVIQNLRRELVAFQSRIRWEVVNEQISEPFRFGLWFGPSSPVDTSGVPAVIVPYQAGKGAYESTRAQVAEEVVAVAAFTPDQKGEAAELLTPWDLVAPDSPAAQHGDPAGP